MPTTLASEEAIATPLIFIAIYTVVGGMLVVIGEEKWSKFLANLLTVYFLAELVNQFYQFVTVANLILRRPNL